MILTKKINYPERIQFELIHPERLKSIHYDLCLRLMQASDEECTPAPASPENFLSEIWFQDEKYEYRMHPYVLSKLFGGGNKFPIVESGNNCWYGTFFMPPETKKAARYRISFAEQLVGRDPLLNPIIAREKRKSLIIRLWRKIFKIRYQIQSYATLTGSLIFRFEEEGEEGETH